MEYTHTSEQRAQGQFLTFAHQVMTYLMKSFTDSDYVERQHSKMENETVWPYQSCTFIFLIKELLSIKIFGVVHILRLKKENMKSTTQNLHVFVKAASEELYLIFVFSLRHTLSLSITHLLLKIQNK